MDALGRSREMVATNAASVRLDSTDLTRCPSVDSALSVYEVENRERSYVIFSLKVLGDSRYPRGPRVCIVVGNREDVASGSRNPDVQCRNHSSAIDQRDVAPPIERLRGELERSVVARTNYDDDLLRKPLLHREPC
jgi:hypothetical protein